MHHLIVKRVVAFLAMLLVAIILVFGLIVAT